MKPRRKAGILTHDSGQAVLRLFPSMKPRAEAGIRRVDGEVVQRLREPSMEPRDEAGIRKLTRLRSPDSACLQ